MTIRIWILINERWYCTSSYKEAIEFASLFRAQIRDISQSGRKEKLNYCGEL